MSRNSKSYGPANPHPLSQLRAEVIWEGKYDEYGNRREVDVAGCSLPMQKIETIDEQRSEAAAIGQLDIFEKQTKRLDDFRNMLIWGENKLVMASLLKDFKGQINLIYIDPPFDVGADFTMNVPLGDEKDTVEKDRSTLEMVAYRDTWGKGQVDFKGKAKTFLRTYGFLSSILPYTDPAWEKLSIFLNFLVPKLPAPKEEDLSKGILEAIDMDSYRVEKKAAMKIQLPDQNAEIEPVPTSGGGRMPEPEIDRLSNILKTFNEQFGNISWTDEDRVRQLITQEIPVKVAADAAFKNAMKNTPQDARIEHDKALGRVMTALIQDETELFKRFSDNPSFKKWLTDTIFTMTSEAPRE